MTKYDDVKTGIPQVQFDCNSLFSFDLVYTLSELVYTKLTQYSSNGMCIWNVD